MRDLQVGLLGFGTVGAGVVKLLARNGELIGARTGVRPVLRRIADLDITTDRGVTVPPGVLTTDAASVINDPAVECIIELIGGTGIAKKFALQALERGKSVVTANKALLAHHGAELFAAAAKGGADLFYEASVAGGVPIIKALREGLAANHILAIHGILNGTCNYILTRMELEGLPFDQVLAEAQKLGYAEANPALDIDGIDTAHKTVILASLAYGQWFSLDDLHVEGIRGLDAQDIRNAADLGYKVKLLGIIKQDAGAIQMRVHPALVPRMAMLAQVSHVFNGVLVKGDFVGNTMFYGRGAGQEATASAVVADLIDVGLNRQHDVAQRVPAFRAHGTYGRIVPVAEVQTRYYLRFTVEDKPRVLARLTAVLGEQGISIASVVQKEVGGTLVPVVMTTHLATEANLRAAVAEIAALDITKAPPVVLRIEDL